MCVDMYFSRIRSDERIEDGDVRSLQVNRKTNPMLILLEHWSIHHVDIATKLQLKVFAPTHSGDIRCYVCAPIKM